MSSLEDPGKLVTIKVKFGPFATSSGAVKLSRHERSSFASVSMGLTHLHDDNRSQNWLECSLTILDPGSGLTFVRVSAVLSRLGP